MFYLGSSFVDPLPWVSCNNTWNSIYCIESVSNTTERQLEINNNVDYCGTVQEAEKNDTIKSTSPSQEFYEYVYCIYLLDDQTFNNINTFNT